MYYYLNLLKKRATTCAIINIIFVSVVSIFAVAEEPLNTTKLLIYLFSIIATLVSFTLVLIFSLQYAKYKKIAVRMIIDDTLKSIQEGDHASYNNATSDLFLVDNMEGLTFEHWCADLLRKHTFTDVTVTQASGDQGVDILATKDGIKYAIQCKCYSSDLGNAPIQEVNAGKEFYRCHVGAVMTNRYFTTGAKELAAATGILLWDRDWIKTHLPTNQSSTINTDVSSFKDELFCDAVNIILTTQNPSVSMLERRLKVGYARAARLIDEMEENGIVGPFQGSKPRDILITKEEWDRKTPVI